MKRFIMFLLCLIMAVNVQAALVGFYDFNDGTANDQSGNHNDPVAQGLGVTIVNGIANFNNSADGFFDLAIPIDAPTSITMGAWIRPNSAGLAGTRPGKILSHDNGGFDRTLGFDSRGGPGGGAGIGMFNGSGVVGKELVSFNEWHFVAVRYDGTTARLTVNDVNIDAADNTGAGFSTVRVGGNPGFNEYYDGDMDNVFFFDEFLSDQDLNAFRASTAPVPLPAALPLFALALGLMRLARSPRKALVH